MTQKTTSIVVLGGGYAGVIAALRVAGRTRRLNVTVKLINRFANFVERPRLPEVAVGKQLLTAWVTSYGHAPRFRPVARRGVSPER